MDAWTKDHPFPIDIDYMISDTLELLRPKMRFCFSLEEATKQVIDLEREVLTKLGIRDTPEPHTSAIRYHVISKSALRRISPGLRSDIPHRGGGDGAASCLTGLLPRTHTPFIRSQGDVRQR